MTTTVAKPALTNFNHPEFISSLKKRKAQTVEQIVRAYHTQLFRAALGQKFSEEDALEVVSSTWDAFFESVERFEGRSHIRTFLFGILYNKMKEKWRDNQKHQGEQLDEFIIEKHFDSTGHWMNVPKDPEKFLEGSEKMEWIEGCLDSLPTKYRMAFYLKEVEGESAENICKIMDTNSNALGVVLFRARLKLRECIEKKSRSA